MRHEKGSDMCGCGCGPAEPTTFTGTYDGDDVILMVDTSTQAPYRRWLVDIATGETISNPDWDLFSMGSGGGGDPFELPEGTPGTVIMHGYGGEPSAEYLSVGNFFSFPPENYQALVNQTHIPAWQFYQMSSDPADVQGFGTTFPLALNDSTLGILIAQEIDGYNVSFVQTRPDDVFYYAQEIVNKGYLADKLEGFAQYETVTLEDVEYKVLKADTVEDENDPDAGKTLVNIETLLQVIEARTGDINRRNEGLAALSLNRGVQVGGNAAPKLTNAALMVWQRETPATVENAGSGMNGIASMIVQESNEIRINARSKIMQLSCSGSFSATHNASTPAPDAYLGRAVQVQVQIEDASGSATGFVTRVTTIAHVISASVAGASNEHVIVVYQIAPFTMTFQTPSEGETDIRRLSVQPMFGASGLPNIIGQLTCSLSVQAVVLGENPILLV